MSRKNILQSNTGTSARPPLFYLWLLPAALLVTVLLTMLNAFSFSENIRFTYKKPAALSANWYYVQDGNPVNLDQLPVKLDLERETLTIHNKLPDFKSDDQVLYFNNRYQGFLVKTGGNILYEYGIKAESASFVSSQRTDHLIPVPARYSGAPVSVTFMNYNHPYAYAVPEILFGTREAVLLQLLTSNIDFIIFLALCLAAGLILLILFLSQHRQRLDYDYFIFLHLGCFMILAAIWLATDSTLLQFLTGNGLAVTLVSFFSFMLMPLPFLSLVGSLCKGGRRVRVFLQCLFIANFLIQAALYAAGLFDFHGMLPVTHLLIAAVFVHILYVLVREIRQTDSYYAKGMFAAIAVFLAFAVVMLAQFYLQQEFWVSLTFRYGLALFLLALTLLAVRKMRVFLRERSKLETYKSLAYMDSLTGMGSRYAYELRMKGLPQEAGRYSRITFILHDLNRLKTANDTLGHDAGDELIRAAADCISSICRQGGDCYRIGGDEFFSIIPDRNVTKEEYGAHLQAAIDTYNRRHTAQLSLSFGVSSSELPLPEGVTFLDLFREADSRMYAHKSLTKNVKKKNPDE